MAHFLREPRRALHARIAETLEREFPDIAENQPEILARHCTEAGQIEKAADLWGKAGQRSLERSALVEAVEQLTRALDPDRDVACHSRVASRADQASGRAHNALITSKAMRRPKPRRPSSGRVLLIEQAEALGEPPEDPLLLFSVLYGVWVANYVAFNGDVVRELAAQFLALAEKQGATVPLMVGHRLMGVYFVHGGSRQGRAHFDRAIALYDPAEHRPLATRFGQDVRVSILSYRSLALWLLGYPEAALADTEQMLNDAREIGQARYVDVCAIPRSVDPPLLRKLLDGKRDGQ